jgi:Cys/Met metabolism PLP-dependent enzyme
VPLRNTGQASGLMTFGVRAGRAGGERFLDAPQLFTRLVNIGDAKSLANHPASTTHRQLSPEELADAPYASGRACGACCSGSGCAGSQAATATIPSEYLQYLSYGSQLLEAQAA